MKIAKIFGALLIFSTLASAIAGGGISLPESDEKKQQKQQALQEWQEQQRLRTENDSGDAPSIARGNTVEAVDPTIVPAEAEASRTSPRAPTQKEIFEQREKMILEAQKKYKNRNAIFFADKAHEALGLGFNAISPNSYNADNLEMDSLAQQQAAVYSSIACDYMDAAQSEASSFNKAPKPYLDAINSQQRALDFLDELKKLNEVGIVNEEQRRKLKVQVTQAREVATQVRTRPGGFSEVIPRYSGPRFFPEMPH